LKERTGHFLEYTSVLVSNFVKGVIAMPTGMTRRERETFLKEVRIAVLATVYTQGDRLLISPVKNRFKRLNQQIEISEKEFSDEEGGGIASREY